MKIQNITRIKILAATCTVLLIFGVLAHPLFQERLANRAACRLADDICEFRDQNSEWPSTLSELPSHVVTEYRDVSMTYDPSELTVTVPLSIVDRHLIRSLWSLMIRSGSFSQTRTSAITIYIRPRYQHRRGH